MQMVKGISWVQSLSQSVISRLKVAYWCLVMLAYLCMNCIDSFHNDAVCTRIFCSLLAIGFIINSICDLQQKEYRWFFKSIFWCAVYNLLDEVLHRACIIDWYEVLFAFITFGYNYYKREKL